MNPSYPTSLDGLDRWATENGATQPEARLRFVQYAVLCAIARDQDLRIALVFKGGNALDFFWQPNRSTLDLDFSVDMSTLDAPLDEVRLRELLVSSLPAIGASHGVAFAVYRVRRQPPGLGKTFVTFHASVGYALPENVRLRARMAAGAPSPNVVPVDVSLNEPITAATVVRLDGEHELRIATLEDIVAEKLRALLQQPVRNRTRPQDLLDIAVVLQRGRSLDLPLVVAALLEKARARNLAVSRAAFRDPAIAERSRQGYEALTVTTRGGFIPFEDA